MNYNLFVQTYLFMAIFLTIVSFNFSSLEIASYSNPFWIYFIEFSFLIFLLIKNRGEIFNLFVLIFILIGVFNSYSNSFNLNIFLNFFRLVIFYSLFKVGLNFKFNPTPFYLLITGFYLFRFFQGVPEPGLFVEFNLECILWLILVLSISENLSKFKSLIFIILNAVLLFYWEANAALLSLIVYLFYDSKKQFWVLGLFLLLWVIYNFINEILMVDRVRYFFAYLNYLDYHTLKAMLPMAGINIPYDSAIYFELSNPGYIDRVGSATSVLYHSNILRTAYDLGIPFGIYFFYKLITKLNNFFEFKYIIIFLVIAISTNAFYGPLALLSMAFIKNKFRVEE